MTADVSVVAVRGWCSAIAPGRIRRHLRVGLAPRDRSEGCSLALGKVISQRRHSPLHSAGIVHGRGSDFRVRTLRAVLRAAADFAEHRRRVPHGGKPAPDRATVHGEVPRRVRESRRQQQDSPALPADLGRPVPVLRRRLHHPRVQAADVPPVPGREARPDGGRDEGVHQQARHQRRREVLQAFSRCRTTPSWPSTGKP